MQHTPKGKYEKYIKRPLDCFIATGSLALSLPVMGVIAIAVRKNLGSPVIFAQERPGRNENPFKLYKFRTMTDECDTNGTLLPDEKRLTKFGAFLRSTSLDELPELINIVKGDIFFFFFFSLLVQYLSRYNEQQARRHEVRPGLTGLAQVNGRNNISWEEKFEWDIKYVDNVTFLEDLIIVLKTIYSVIKREGISSDTHATMEEFIGIEKDKQ